MSSSLGESLIFAVRISNFFFFFFSFSSFSSSSSSSSLSPQPPSLFFPVDIR
jgi:hypothetical protein